MSWSTKTVHEKWVMDVTEFSVKEEKLCLSPLLVICNREVMAYSFTDQPIVSLINDMQEKAFLRLGKGGTPRLHSDQGWQ